MRVYQKINILTLISTTLFLSCIIRFLFYFYVLDAGIKSWILVDSDHYHQMALSITQGNYQTPLSFLRLPGYPAFLASCYTLFGEYPTYALITQIILASVIPLLMYVLTKVLFPKDPTLALCSAIYSSVHLGFVLYAGMLSTESLFLIFLLLFFICFLNHNPTIFMAGLLLGICSLIRPVGHFMLIISCIILFLRDQDVKQISMLTGSWLLIVGPWLLRNYLLTGALFFHTLPGQHFLQYSAAYVYQDAHNVSYIQARRALMDEFDNTVNNRKLNEIERCAIAEKIAYKQLREHPILAIKHSLIHMAKSCIAPQSQLLLYLDSNWTYEPGTTVSRKINNFICPPVHNKLLFSIIYVDLITHFLLWLGALLFIFSSLLRTKNLWLIFCACMFSALFIAITLAYGSARLRLPIEPFLIIFAFKFLLDLRKNNHEQA